MSESAYIFPLDIHNGPKAVSPYWSDHRCVGSNVSNEMPPNYSGPRYTTGTNNRNWFVNDELCCLMQGLGVAPELIWTSDRIVGPLYTNRTFSFGEYWALLFENKSEAMRFKLAMPNEYMNTKLYQVLNESRSRE